MNRREFIGGAALCAAVGLWFGDAFASPAKALVRLDISGETARQTVIAEGGRILPGGCQGNPTTVMTREGRLVCTGTRGHGVLLLTFDDALFHSWDKALPIFDRYGAHATFFVDGRGDVRTAIKKMREYQSRGHSVGFHSAGHVPAKPIVAQKGIDAWLKSQIEPQVVAAKKANLTVRNFAYPNSSRTDETDAALKPYFNRLRTGHLFNRDPAKCPLATCDEAFISRDKLVSSHLLWGMGFSSKFPGIADDLEKGLERLAARNEALVLYSHDIKEKPDGDCHNTSLDVLERILSKARALGIEVIGFDEIASPRLAVSPSRSVADSRYAVSDAEVFVDNRSRGRSGHMGHALVDCGRGRILAFNSNVPTNRCDGHSGYGWMEYRVSKDYGRSWGAPRVLDYSMKVFREGKHTALCEKGVRAPDGRIILFFQITDASRPISCEPWSEPTWIESRDGGETWSDARVACPERGRIYDAVVDRDSVYFLLPTSPNFCDTNQEYVVYKSTDGGPFARHATSIEGAKKGYGAMEFAPDGSLVVYAYDSLDEAHPQYCISRDRGVTWEKPGRCTCVKLIRNPQVRRIGDDWFMCGRNGGSCDGLVLYHSKNGIDWDEGVKIAQRPDGTGTGFYSCLQPIFEPGRPPRLLLQYSRPYRAQSVNVEHRWIEPCAVSLAAGTAFAETTAAPDGNGSWPEEKGCLSAKGKEKMTHTISPMFCAGGFYGFYQAGETHTVENVVDPTELMRLSVLKATGGTVTRSFVDVGVSGQDFGSFVQTTKRPPCAQTAIEKDGLLYLFFRGRREDMTSIWCYRNFDTSTGKLTDGATICTLDGREFNGVTARDAYNRTSGDHQTRTALANECTVKLFSDRWYYMIVCVGGDCVGLVVRSRNLKDWSSVTATPDLGKGPTMEHEIAELAPGKWFSAWRQERLGGVWTAAYDVSTRTWSVPERVPDSIAVKPCLFARRGKTYLATNLKGPVTTPGYGTAVRATLGVFEVSDAGRIRKLQTIVNPTGCHYVGTVEDGAGNLYLCHSTDERKLDVTQCRSNIVFFRFEPQTSRGGER